MRVLLVITVLAFGGPAPGGPYAMPGVWVKTTHHIVRTNEKGRARLWLRPGVYPLTIASNRFCDSGVATLRQRMREFDVTLRCSIS
jgi:hypothetical protein